MSAAIHTRAFAALTAAAIACWTCACHAKSLRVDATRQANGNDTFHSIRAALEHLTTGDTLVIGPGVYRESIDLRTAHLRPSDPNDARITRIEAAQGAQPLIKGSDVVTDWQRVGANLYAKRGWSINSQQVFVEGEALKQIGGIIFGDFPNNPRHALATLHQSQGGIWPGRTPGGVEAMTDNSFFYDQDAQTLFVRSNLDIRRRTVEVSTRAYSLFGADLEHVEIHGLHFAHANTTSVAQSGAIALMGQHLTLANIHVQDVDGAGMDLTGDDITVMNSQANRCGSVGMKVRGRGARLIDNETNYNNTRGFNKWWEAGGAKFVGAGGLRNSEIDGHRAFGNLGDGLWFDWHNDNNRIHRVVTAYNAGMGIHYEASNRAYIYDSFAFGNSQRGIYLANSSNSIVAHNLVAANAMEGIAIVDDRHAAVKGPNELIPTGNRVVANVVAWNAKAALVLPDSPDNESDANYFVDAAPGFSRGWPTREQPLSVGLAAWQTRSGTDRTSTSNAAKMPADLRSRLDSRESESVEQLWRDLLLEARSIESAKIANVPPELNRVGSAPGPKL